MISSSIMTNITCYSKYGEPYHHYMFIVSSISSNSRSSSSSMVDIIQCSGCLK